MSFHWYWDNHWGSNSPPNISLWCTYYFPLNVLVVPHYFLIMSVFFPYPYYVRLFSILCPYYVPEMSLSCSLSLPYDFPCISVWIPSYHFPPHDNPIISLLVSYYVLIMFLLISYYFLMFAVLFIIVSIHFPLDFSSCFAIISIFGLHFSIISLLFPLWRFPCVSWICIRNQLPNELLPLLTILLPFLPWFSEPNV